MRRWSMASSAISSSVRATEIASAMPKVTTVRPITSGTTKLDAGDPDIAGIIAPGTTLIAAMPV